MSNAYHGRPLSYLLEKGREEEKGNNFSHRENSIIPPLYSCKCFAHAHNHHHTILFLSLFHDVITIISLSYSHVFYTIPNLVKLKMACHCAPPHTSYFTFHIYHSFPYFVS